MVYYTYFNILINYSFNYLTYYSTYYYNAREVTMSAAIDW